MSKTAEDVSTTLALDGNRDEPSVDATDEVAALLAGEDEPKPKDDEEEETPTAESKKDEGEESNEEEAKE